jgi:hypothetical protein
LKKILIGNRPPVARFRSEKRGGIQTYSCRKWSATIEKPVCGKPQTSVIQGPSRDPNLRPMNELAKLAQDEAIVPAESSSWKK